MKSVLNVKNVPVQDRIMFFGPDLSLQRYDEFKYPRFFELWEQQENYRWRPQRIDLSKDRTDYQRMTDTERFVFESNIRWQTMTDSMLSRSIHKVSEYVTNPELELCIGTWSSMEQMHSFSYTHIFKNITNDATKFFNSILEDDEIVKRARQISKSYDDLLGEEENMQEKVLWAILCTNITESISFYNSFVCSFFFGYRGLMEGSAKIISEIARDERLHVAITQNIIGNWQKYPEERYQKILKDNEDGIYELFKLSVKNEKDWIDYLFSRGTLLGLNPNILSAYVEWLANTRLNALGYKKIFKTKNNPISGWSDRYFDSSLVQIAPQETEIESYLTGATNTSINEEELGRIEL